MKQIKTTVDKNDESLIVFQSDKLSHTPAIPLVLKVYADLLERGWVNSVIPFNDNSRVIWAQRNDGSVAGGICYEYRAGKQCGWIILSFTAEHERRKGINAILNELVEDDCRLLGATHISSYVNVNNKPMIQSLNSIGRDLVLYKTRKNI